MEKSAYDVLLKTAPSTISVIRYALSIKKTPKKIAKMFEDRDVSLAAIVELVATYMLEKGV